MASGSHSNYSSSDMIRDDPKRQIKCAKYIAHMENMHTRFQCKNPKR
jgi:hypothetical protein